MKIYSLHSEVAKHASFLTPAIVGRRRPLPPKICAQSDPPPQLRPISAYNVSNVRASEKVQLSRIGSQPRAYRWAINEVRTLPLSPLKVGSKSKFVIFVNKNQFKSNKLCYKVSLCENCQQQSCSRAIPLSNGVYMLAVNVTLCRSAVVAARRVWYALRFYVIY